MNLPLRIVPALLPVLMLGIGIGVGKAQNFGAADDPQPVAAIATGDAEGCVIEAPDGLAVLSRPASTGSASRISGRRSAPPCSRPSAPQKIRRRQPNSGDFGDCKSGPAHDQMLLASSVQLDEAQATATYYDCYTGDDGYISHVDAALGKAHVTAMFNDLQEDAERVKQPASSATS